MKNSTAHSSNVTFSCEVLFSVWGDSGDSALGNTFFSVGVLFFTVVTLGFSAVFVFTVSVLSVKTEKIL